MKRSAAPMGLGRRGYPDRIVITNHDDNKSYWASPQYSDPINMESLRAALIARAIDLYPKILASPNPAMSSRRELRFGRKGSICVVLAGESTGLWYGYEKGRGGNLIQLIMEERGFGFGHAVKLAMDLVGGTTVARPSCLLKAATVRLALRLWNEAVNPRGTIVDRYLSSRRLSLPDDIAGDTIRFHAGIGAMMALFRVSNHACGIHRTVLDRKGRKLGRKMLGRVKGCAIKLDPPGQWLCVAEGLESALAARQLGFSPVWALGSAKEFAPIDGANELIILGEHDEASRKAADACAQLWTEQGRCSDPA